MLNVYVQSEKQKERRDRKRPLDANGDPVVSRGGRCDYSRCEYTIVHCCVLVRPKKDVPLVQPQVLKHGVSYPTPWDLLERMLDLACAERHLSVMAAFDSSPRYVSI